MSAPNVTPGSAAPPTTPSGRPFNVAAFILALISLAMMPPAGIVGIVCGAIGYSRGDRKVAVWAIVASVAGFIGGFIIAGIVLTEVVDGSA
jgi:hypothetical protein